MLEVGNLATPAEDRAHFGAWAVVSSPLILGFDMTNASTMARVWPTISNQDALRVNQQWAGHPGRLVRAWSPPTPPAGPLFALGEPCNASAADQHGFRYNPATQAVELQPMGQALPLCLGMIQPRPNASLAKPPSPSSDLHFLPCSGATRVVHAAGGQLQVADKLTVCVDLFCDPCHPGAPLNLMPCHNNIMHGGGGNQEFIFADGSMKAQNGPCITAGSLAPTAPDSRDAVKDGAFSLWAKPQPGGAQAVLLLSNQGNTTRPSTVEISFAEIFGGTFSCGCIHLSAVCLCNFTGWID